MTSPLKLLGQFLIQPPGPLGKKNCSNGLGHMTKMTAIPIYGKNLKKSSSPEPIDWWPWNLVCSIVYASTSKVIQIITLSWPCLFYAKVKFIYIGFCMGKSENYVLLRNYCSHRPQIWFKYSTKWVNEAKWVSKSRSLFDLGQRSLRFQNLILFFSETIKSFGTKFHMKAYGWKGMKIYTNE